MKEVVLAAEASEWGGWMAQLQALRSATEPSVDPVRLHYIEALARRMHAAPPAVQKVLQAKLADALKTLGGGAEPVVTARPEPVGGLAAVRSPRKAKLQAQAAPPVARLSLLGQLNQHIQTASASPLHAVAPQPRAHPQDLKSALRFRETWARISAETQVDQAAIRAPENAGPLNAHNLVLRTLSLMRELSPDYLRRFMGHTESLLWLDQAQAQLRQPAKKAKLTKAPKA